SRLNCRVVEQKNAGGIARTRRAIEGADVSVRGIDVVGIHGIDRIEAAVAKIHGLPSGAAARAAGAGRSVVLRASQDDLRIAGMLGEVNVLGKGSQAGIQVLNRICAAAAAAESDSRPVEGSVQSAIVSEINNVGTAGGKILRVVVRMHVRNLPAAINVGRV